MPSSILLERNHRELLFKELLILDQVVLLEDQEDLNQEAATMAVYMADVNLYHPFSTHLGEFSNQATQILP